MDATLIRWCYHPTMGTFGTLSVAAPNTHGNVGTLAWPTVEQPWRDNAVGKSCIPLGVYRLKLGMYYHGDGPGGKEDYPAFEVLGVPGRTEIKIHRGNVATDVRGCIAPGNGLGAIGNVWAVLQSGEALRQFMAAMGTEDGRLTVRNTDNLGIIAVPTVGP